MKGKIAIVTGGTRGIGDAISTRFLQDGATVIAVATNQAKCDQWVTAKKAKGFANVEAYECNVTDFNACAALVKKIKEKHGKVDILVNNAGITADAGFKKMTKELWDKVISTNLDSLFNMTRNVFEVMTENKYGRIINISSVNGRKGCFGQANYASTKSAMYGFTKTLAAEGARSGITVNTISPGYINTDMMKTIPKDVMDSKIISQIPVGRLGEPEEIANAAAFIANDTGFLTGSDISINGGQYMY